MIAHYRDGAYDFVIDIDAIRKITGFKSDVIKYIISDISRSQASK